MVFSKMKDLGLRSGITTADTIKKYKVVKVSLGGSLGEVDLV